MKDMVGGGQSPVARWPTAPNRRPPTVLSPGWATGNPCPAAAVGTYGTYDTDLDQLVTKFSARLEAPDGTKPLLHTYLLTSIKGMEGIVGADKSSAARVS